MTTARTTESLLERGRELGSLVAVLDEAGQESGRLALVEGPAGIGKSRLLGEVRAGANERGARVLAARGSELEREFPFGVVRQLFEPALADDGDRERWLTGAAAPAGTIFDATANAEPLGDATFATLHALYWLTVGVAADGPLVLAVDDLHWCDRASLRYLAYLAHRLEGLPVLVATTLRSTDPGTDPALIAEIAGDTATVSVRPGPLSAAATTEMVRVRLGAHAASRFCAACHVATGGNPLLLLQLLSSLEADRVTPDVAHIDVVRDIGPRAVSRTVLLRLARLPEEAVAVARAVAVLGESADLPAVARLAELPPAAVAEATAALARAEILRPEPPLGFVHPLVRDAIYHELSSGERELMHDRAARELIEIGAGPDRVAAHLLSISPRGEAWVAETLQEAAHGAVRRGAPESAGSYLQRALQEPPAPARRAQILLELGIAETHTRAPLAIEHLQEAYRLQDDPEIRGFTGLLLARTLLFGVGPEPGAEMAARAAAELPAEFVDMHRALEAVQLISVYLGATNVERWPERSERARGEPIEDAPGSRFLAATAAYAWMVAGGPHEECASLALEAFEGEQLLRSDNGLFWAAAGIVLGLADHPDADATFERARAEAHRAGSAFSILSVDLWLGWHLFRSGELEDADESLRQAIYGTEAYGSTNPEVGSYPGAFLASVQILRGDVDGAADTLARVPRGGERFSDGLGFLMTADVELALAQDRPAEALAIADELARLGERTRNPTWAAWRTLRAQALARLDRRDEAIEAAAEELERAHAWGTATAVGRGLRVLGELKGRDGIAELREAADVLERSPAKVERALALASLGAELRRARRPSDARDPLRRALELAERCGAAPLAERARSELYATGARPRTTALEGVESLTERELRVASMASDGQTNRDIAQALYVTPKTVEVHLTSVYRKLGIGSRRQLPRALAA